MYPNQSMTKYLALIMLSIIRELKELLKEYVRSSIAYGEGRYAILIMWGLVIC